MTAALLLSAFNQYGFNSPGSATNFAVDATDKGIACLIQANSTDPIERIGFRYGARTGTPPAYIVAIESIDASGLPSGTVLGGGSPASATFTPPASTAWDGTYQWVALANSYTPTLGQFLALTIRYSSGTVGAGNTSSFTTSYGGVTSASDARSFPCSVTLSTTWTKSSTALTPMAYRTASGRYGMIIQSEYTTLTANTATHKSGMYWTLPSGWGSAYQVAGLRGMMKLGAAGGSCKVAIWQTDGTELASVTIDSDFAGNLGSNTCGDVYFTSLATLNYGTKYYAGVEVISGTCGVNGIVLAEAADRSWFPNGTNRGLMTNAGSFVETDTTMPLLDLIMADITVPSGSTGGVLIGGRNVR